jgi:hypothetical protein
MGNGCADHCPDLVEGALKEGTFSGYASGAPVGNSSGRASEA